MDLDNITIPTSVAGLAAIIPSYLPVQLVAVTKPCQSLPCQSLPCFVPVGTCGFTIYAVATFEQKMAACQYISQHGPPVPPSSSVYLFSTSTLSVSSATLFEAFNMAKITTVAIFCYGMKCEHIIWTFLTICHRHLIHTGRENL